MAHFKIQGTTAYVVLEDGTEQALSTIIAEACKGTGAVMDEFRSENQGRNVSVGFNNTYFPKRGEVTGNQRSQLNVRKARAHLAIYTKLVEMGVSEEDMTFSEGFSGKNGWVGSKRLYFNSPQAQTSTGTSGPVETLKALKKAYMAAGGDIKAYLEMHQMADGDEDILVGWLKHQVKVLGTSQETRSITRQIQDDVPEMDGGDEVPDTSNM